MNKRSPTKVDCLRDVGVEGSNPFTPTNSPRSVLDTSSHRRRLMTRLQKPVPFRKLVEAVSQL